MKYIFSAIFLYLFFGLLLFVFQRRIVFNKSGYPGKPKDYNLFTTKEIQIPTEDNINLLCWLYNGDKDLPLLIYFHGNSFHIGDRAHRIQKYIDKKWNVLLVSWRGFGGNKGSPTEKNLYKDGEAVLKWVSKNTLFTKKKIVVYEDDGENKINANISSFSSVKIINYYLEKGYEFITVFEEKIFGEKTEKTIRTVWFKK